MNDKKGYQWFLDQQTYEKLKSIEEEYTQQTKSTQLNNTTNMTQEDKYIKENKLDEIDAFLFREFGILGGACSAQMASRYYTARQVAEKLWKKSLKEKQQ